MKNKVFRNGTIDGVELFDSIKKCCNNCLTRVDKNGMTHYFHRSVVCAMVGSDPHTVLDRKCLSLKKIVQVKMKEKLLPANV